MGKTRITQHGLLLLSTTTCPLRSNHRLRTSSPSVWFHMVPRHWTHFSSLWLKSANCSHWECQLLALGVPTYDAEALQNFELHAYPLTFSGDLPAISKLLCLQRHGIYSPCCSCLIQGEHIQGTHNIKYYAVLISPWHPGQPCKDPYDPHNLPSYTHRNLQETLEAINRACGLGDGHQIGMEHGVHRLSMVFHLLSIHFHCSFLHDIMHIFFENICPTLVNSKIWQL